MASLQKSLRAVILLLLTLALASACGPAKQKGKDPVDAGHGVPDAGPITLDSAEWTLEIVAPSPGTITHSPSLTFTASGIPWLAFSEPGAVEINDQDIFTLNLAGGGAAEARTQDVHLQNAFPVVRAQGEQLHLVYSGFAGGDSDIYYSHGTGGTWSANEDLTSAFEDASTPRNDYSPALAVGPSGERAVAFVSEPFNMDPPDIRVLTFDASGTVQGPPVTVIPAFGTIGCSAPVAAYEASGALHVIASCGDLYTSSLFHAFKLGTQWDHVQLFPETVADNINPALRASPDGSVLHLVWVQTKTCGSLSCSNALAVTVRGNDTSAPVQIAPDQEFFAPAIGVDPFGRLLVAFHKWNAQNMAELFVTWSEDTGATFAPPRNLTPGNVSFDDWNAGDWAFDAHGHPHFVSVRVFKGSDPLNSEIVHGYVK